MTLRLVGLMSLVLALCLATFAFMTRRYHDEVMQELPRTVAQAGREAIRSLEPSRFGEVAPTAAWRVGERMADERLRAYEERAAQLHEVAARAAEHTTARFFVTHETVDGEKSVEVVDCAGSDCFTWQSQDGEGAATQVIDLAAIHAESDPSTGVVLRIPTLRAMSFTTTVVRGESAAAVESVEPVEPVEPPTSDVFVQDTSTSDHELRIVMQDVERRIEAASAELAQAGAIEAGAVPAVLPFPAVHDREIVLPIGTGDYQDLYDRYRNKSLLLLAGVFAVGLALTSGLASRFTRPVRQLDGALREISDGNLDVRVPVHGSDELARLGRAFNEMTGKLKENRDRARELTRREKLSALGRLAAGVAHDVRNPLHSISLTLEHLRDTARPDDDERGHDFDRSLEIIREEIRRLDGLVTSFLRFAASGGRERTRVGLGSLVDEVVRLVRKEAEWRNIRVRSEVVGGDPAVVADVESIRSAVLNLVLNSFEAMPDGGDLCLTVRSEHGEALLEVRDTGVGIPEDDRERVFEFAYSTREDGNGLGLAIVHQCVVEDHGGRIALDSRVGEGTTITLRFPDADSSEVRS